MRQKRQKLILSYVCLSGRVGFELNFLKGGLCDEKLISVTGVFVLGLFIFASVSLAQHSHGGMSTGTPMKMETKDVLVEGVKVILHGDGQ